MTEAVQPHTFSDLSRETRLTYRALCRDEALYGDTLAIIAGCPTQEAAALALEHWIGVEENPLSDGLGLYAQLLALALDRIDWPAVVTAFTPEDPRAAQDLIAREAYDSPEVLTGADSITTATSPLTRSLPTGE